MYENKIVIRPKLKSFTNIFYICFGIMTLVVFFCLLIQFFLAYRKQPAMLDLPILIIGFCLYFLGFIVGGGFLFAPLGKKITICGKLLEYQNWFFFHHKIKITAESKIRMGECYPAWGAHPELIWKISNHRGKEKVKIHANYFDYKKVNAELENLTGYKIEYSRANITF